MILLRLTYDSGKNRFVAETDDGSRFFLSYETVQETQLRPDMVIDETTRELLENESEKMRAWELALQKITRTVSGSHQIRRYLLQKKLSESAVESVLIRLTNTGLLDDEQILAAFVSDSVHIKKHGLYRIRHEAVKRGFDRESVDAAYRYLMNSESPPDSESARAEELARARWPRIRGKTTEHRRKKLSDYLVRCGFSFEIINDIVERYGEDEI